MNSNALLTPLQHKSNTTEQFSRTLGQETEKEKELLFCNWKIHSTTINPKTTKLHYVFNVSALNLAWANCEDFLAHNPSGVIITIWSFHFNRCHQLSPHIILYVFFSYSVLHLLETEISGHCYYRNTWMTQISTKTKPDLTWATSLISLASQIWLSVLLLPWRHCSLHCLRTSHACQGRWHWMDKTEHSGIHNAVVTKISGLLRSANFPGHVYKLL